jgi:uncharacterized RDD family membrane protein YckC
MSVAVIPFAGPPTLTCRDRAGRRLVNHGGHPRATMHTRLLGRAMNPTRPTVEDRTPASRAAGRRVVAWCLDWLILSVYAAALIPVGVLVLSRWDFSPLAGNAIGFVLLVVPATVWVAAWEQGPRGATPGKRLLRLRVRDDAGARLGWKGSLARNALKVALPWELGHTAAFTLADPHASGAAVACGLSGGVAACLIAVTYVITLFLGTGRTPYDHASGAHVVPLT